MKGVTFGSYHSFNDFGMMLSSKEIGSPEPKIITIDVEGGDGVLDFTEFAGETKFKNRKLTFHFSIPNVLDTFMQIFSDVHNALHGQKMKIILDDDPDFYYIGRITVNEFKADASIGLITVECDCEPWKYKKDVTMKKVYLYGKNLFDTASFEQGTINNHIGYCFESEKSASSTRIRSKRPIYFDANTKYTITVPSGFDIALRVFDKNEIMIYTTGWRNGTYAFTTNEQAYSIGITIRYNDDSKITPSDIENEQFQFEKGNATTYEPFLESNTVSVSLSNLRKTVIPIIHASGDVSILFEGNTIAMNYETGRNAILSLGEGSHPLTITGNGSVVFEYQEGGF